MNEIIVGVDKSETSIRAAEKAAEMATAYGTGLHLVMCVDRSRTADVKVGSDHFHADWVSEAEQYLDALGKRLGVEKATHSVETGAPAKALCDAALRLDARAIVVGNRRVQGISRVLGSVASDVARQAPCDVLVANTTADV